MITPATMRPWRVGLRNLGAHLLHPLLGVVALLGHPGLSLLRVLADLRLHVRLVLTRFGLTLLRLGPGLLHLALLALRLTSLGLRLRPCPLLLRHARADPTR